MSQKTAEAALREGKPDVALKALQEAVRAKPDDAKLRIFLFQLLCVLGQWQRALNQLGVCSEMDGLAMPMKQMYEGPVSCEALREQVFAGKKAPMLFGEPEPWLALLIESLLRAGAGEDEASATLRAQAFDAAPTSAGTLDGKPFQWIADADSRLGPVLEAMINGRYYWIPFARISNVKIEPPEDLRDFVWLPSTIQFSNGGEMPALLPVRYPGSEKSDDGLIQLARRTEWQSLSEDAYAGLGQRILTTDEGDFPLLECKEIVFAEAAEE